jgi:hypothetical protein
MWGQTKKKEPATIQGIDYMNAEAGDYADAWVVRDAKLRSRANHLPVIATLVFVAGPNAKSDERGNPRNSKSKGPRSKKQSDYGSMSATVNKRAAVDYDFFKECVETSVRAGLRAMGEENVTHALVARVSCGVYAGIHRKRIHSEFLGIVQSIVDTLGIGFEQVTIVTV